MKKNKNKKEIRFIAATILLILVIVFCMTETVKSQDSADRGAKNKYYASMEKQYVEELRTRLNSLGYHNSGITVRWIAEDDGTRCYNVMIHHNRISGLGAADLAALVKILSETEFEDASCSFCYEFITV